MKSLPSRFFKSYYYRRAAALRFTRKIAQTALSHSPRAMLFGPQLLVAPSAVFLQTYNQPFRINCACLPVAQLYSLSFDISQCPSRLLSQGQCCQAVIRHQSAFALGPNIAHLNAAGISVRYQVSRTLLRYQQNKNKRWKVFPVGLQSPTPPP